MHVIVISSFSVYWCNYLELGKLIHCCFFSFDWVVSGKQLNGWVVLVIEGLFGLANMG